MCKDAFGQVVWSVCLGVLTTVSLHGELVAPTLSLSESMVELRWAVDPDVTLQEASGLEGPWISLEDTLGKDIYRGVRRSEGQFFRLMQTEVPDDPSGELLRRLESKIAKTVEERLHRSSLPPSERDDFVIDADGNPSRAVSQEPFAWVSQPGMIRTYGSDAQFAEAFPLYSTSGPNVMTSSEELEAEVEKLQRWHRVPHRYADINKAEVTFSENGDEISRRFPIYDWDFERGSRPEGLSDGAPSPPSGEDFRAEPMPVQWLYVLADGSEGTLDEAGHYTGEGEISQENPMVARYAFWTDDESTKINVNTASEAIPWETPTIQSPLDLAYAEFPPVTDEVQRYPGHPATTCLSALFYPDKSAGDPTNGLSESELTDLFAIAPKVTAVEPRAFDEAEPAVFDDEPLYQNLDDFHQRNPKWGNQYDSLITTVSVSPETTLHGRPRMSLWPIHVIDDESHRSNHDQHAATRTSLAGKPYFVQRERPESAYHDLYSVGERANIAFFRHLMDQVYRPLPTINGSLAQKYGAQETDFDFKSDSPDNRMDHVSIATQMVDYIRATNLADGRLANPFADRNAITGWGQVTPLSWLSRDLDSGDGSTEHAEKIFEAYAEPRGHGRDLMISEVALVLYVTSQARLGNIDGDGRVVLRSLQGPGNDINVIEAILSNGHPGYEGFLGRRYDETDVGKTFGILEVGMIVEGFSVSQGYPHILPRKSVRLLTEGPDYLGGVDLEMGLKVNGVPLAIWGNTVNGAQDLKGPMVMSVAPSRPLEDRFPTAWSGIGGVGGARLFRHGEFTLDEESPGFFGDQFLPNTRGPLFGFYCQSPVVIEMGEPVVLTQESPIQLAVYNGVGAEMTKREQLQQIYHLRYAAPGKEIALAAPRKNSQAFSGWTRRFREDNGRNIVLYLEPSTDQELVKGLIVSHGDYRQISSRRLIPSELFTPHPETETAHASHSLSFDLFDWTSGLSRRDSYTTMRDGVEIGERLRPDYASNAEDRDSFAPMLSEAYKFAVDPSITRDVDTGLPARPDGAYIRMPDAGGVASMGRPAYFNQTFPSKDVVPSSHFSPHRQVTSPVAFGSLPTGVQAQIPWTTLLFRPHLAMEQAEVGNRHLGQRGNGLRYIEDRQSLEGFSIPQFASVSENAALPGDHHWLDLFWMPASVPSHLTTPFATAGKVNMNYEMMPFRHLRRETALHAVLKSEQLLAIPNWAGRTYKTEGNNFSWRHRIDIDETLKQFDEKFARGELFLTESEICEQYLVPKGVLWDSDGRSVRQFWDAHRLSGDDVLERPYANIHARLTTRSNAFKLHYKIETIEKSTESDPTTFVDGSDRVINSQQGAKLLVRELDVTDPRLPDYRSDREHTKPRIEHFYRWGIR